MKIYKTDGQIVEEAPANAVTYCWYEYGDEMEGLYLNSENQFWESEDGRWVDMNLVDDYFHNHRRLDDIRDLNRLRAELKIHREYNAQRPA